MSTTFYVVYLKKFDKTSASSNLILVDYKNVRDSAWHFLINNNVRHLPLDLFQIAEQHNWITVLFEDNVELVKALDKENHNSNCDGFTCVYKNQIFIIYKRTNNIARLRFTIAHEFGHIMLLHLNKLVDNEYEREANMFAARILMPICVIKECKAYTPKQISELCGVSLTAATFRAKRLQELMTRNKFYTSPYEKLLIKQFENFIKQKRF